ncbi:uncharacterized protein BYT42DRAFT_566271 [Radiomyces spectabilis]|uniref:uncharacterized protein n=1 Tax=Radiomyces spectabilis TaxID=64574 RepID=UPI00221F7143|nr:uncharacterized protein BYT42DRAFT_566271 [Radiomyces spectabilis]KAI8381361.1 hypothetical protein BYT42DRAFT_566271 [Radiomyces spectabilis]
MNPLVEALGESQTNDGQTNSVEDESIDQASEAVLNDGFNKEPDDSKREEDPCENHNGTSGTTSKVVDNKHRQKHQDEITKHVLSTFNTVLNGYRNQHGLVLMSLNQQKITPVIFQLQHLRRERKSR